MGGQPSLEFWLIGQEFSLPLTGIVFRALLVGLAALGHFRGRPFWRIFRSVSRRGSVSVASSASLEFRVTLIVAGLDETIKFPITRFDTTGLTRIQEGAFRRLVLTVLEAHTGVVPTVHFHARLQ